jgi:phospholipase C
MPGGIAMKPLAERISTVVLVMMENRSFDHMLGHLSLQGLVPEVDGLLPDFSQYENRYEGGVYRPFEIPPGALPFDLPHEYRQVATQLAFSQIRDDYDMTGFVKAYMELTTADGNSNSEPITQAIPMGYFPSRAVPITSFLAKNFRVCDRWHCSLPTSTQPNRTMAFFGSSEIFDTKGRLIPSGDSMFHWLEKARVRWRVYHDGLSFFALYPKAWPYVLSDNFRDFENYFHDMQVEAIDSGPQVIIVEPSYNDGPHLGPDHPNDNHPPLAIGWGEDYLRRVYQAAIVDRERWAKTVMVYYHDEHGGFYDHVPPPRIGYTTTGHPQYVFDSLGPRIPAVVVSPLVADGTVCHELLDHTSVLQFLAELFTPGEPYSSTVEARRTQGISSLSMALDDVARTDVPVVPADPIPVTAELGTAIRVRPENGNQASFELAATQLMDSNHDAVARKYPELFQWRAAVDAERQKVPG